MTRPSDMSLRNAMALGRWAPVPHLQPQHIPIWEYAWPPACQILMEAR